MKEKLLTLAIATTTLFGIGSAHAEVTAYGRVTYNLISDDTSDDTYFGRHEFAETTIGIKGSKDWGNLKIAANIEFGLNEGVSDLLQDGSNARNRIQEFSLSGSFGTVSLGTGPSITFVISDVDQSGTWFSDPLGMSARFGSTRRGPGGQSQTPFVQGQSIFNERIRYDSPTLWGGATFHAQLNEDSGSEFALKYSAQNGIRFNAWSVDHGDGDNDDDPQQNVDGFRTSGFFGAESGAGALIGYKHQSGFNISATSIIADQLDDGERDLNAVKLGYTFGKHAVSVSRGSYGSENAEGIDDADHDRTTLAYNFKPVGGVQFWLQATSGDTDGQSSFDSVAIGGLVKL
ncbi:MAG: hypothetical protein ACI9SP_003581 [Arenicella sp.]|jgi:hypothetical protein